MNIIAKVHTLLPLQTGTGKNGEWKKQDVVFETQGQYPKKICISFWGDKIIESLLRPGNMLNVSFDVESREYNGRWYTDVKAWKTEPAGKGGEQPSYEVTLNQSSGVPAREENTDLKDDLPF